MTIADWRSDERQRVIQGPEDAMQKPPDQQRWSLELQGRKREQIGLPAMPAGTYQYRTARAIITSISECLSEDVHERLRRGGTFS